MEKVVRTVSKHRFVFRHFLLKVPFTRWLYLSPHRFSIKNTTVQNRFREFLIFNFLFAINKMSSINRHGGFLSKILQFNEYTIYSARNSPIYFPIHGQNCGDGIAQSLASMPQPTREFYIASRFSPIVYYTRINNIKAARNRPVSNAESLPFVVRGLRNPSSPRISHLHLSVSNARFWNRARAFYMVCVHIYVYTCVYTGHVRVARGHKRVHQASEGSCTAPGGLCNYRKSKIEGRKRGGSSAGLCFPQTASYYVI